MHNRKSLRRLCVLVLVFLTTSSASLANASVTRPLESKSAHKDDPLNYEVVFPQNAVNTITITIDAKHWQAMQDDLTALFGKFGAGTRRPGGGDFPGGGGEGGVGGGDFTEANPIWIPADISFNGKTWANVGMRYKGNSSLAGAWSSGSLKLGFKLNFDKFEDDFPAIKNQRFYGFDELSFSSNFRDTSYLHEKVAADIFREAGIPAAHTAFYAVTMDYGNGPVYIGLYTAVEVIEDTVIKTQFSDDSGNLYKPEGAGASFQAGSFDEASFSKETNEDEANFSDILALFDVLHTSTRTTDPAAWRTQLESVLNVDEFIHWLAVNTVIQNWDVYGVMAHNYYLYNDPETGRLTWIPWDNNEALTSRSGRRGSNSGAFDLTRVSPAWPLIRYLMDDPVYRKMYVAYVEDTIKTAFEPTKMETTLSALHSLIAPYVVGDGGAQAADSTLESPQSFENSLTELIDHVKQRNKAARDYLDKQANTP
ncbi:MAG: CotH kinase family protein [Anaerolineae bacterium]|nr:CotH kinase family protein [Anaerolineae bacterium]